MKKRLAALLTVLTLLLPLTPAQAAREEARLSLAADLAPYHFELMWGEEETATRWSVYLMDETSGDTGVLLPHMGDAIAAKGLSVGKITAEYNAAGDIVTLSVLDKYQGEGLMASIDYPVSSLDWCLANLRRRIRGPRAEAWATSENASEIQLSASYYTYVSPYEVQSCPLMRRDSGEEGQSWKQVEAFRGKPVRVLPYNGKTFVVLEKSTMTPWSSPDGLEWTAHPELATEGDYADFAFLWTGEGYLVCQKAGTGRYGMFGSSGGDWDSLNTQVRLLDETFREVWSHDFGRLVEAVGWCNNTCYAKVSNSTGTRDGMPGDPGVFDDSLGSTLYRSTDGGKTWAATDYLDVMAGMTELSERAQWVFSSGGARGEKTDRVSRAEAGGYRFVYVGVEVYLLTGSETDGVLLPHMGQALRERDLYYGDLNLSAELVAPDLVRVAVTDREHPERAVSLDYPTSSLDWVAENLSTPSIREPISQATKPAEIDLALLHLEEGRELVYRNAATGGRYQLVQNVPWGIHASLLPWNGKTFTVVDQDTLNLYASEDGLNWKKVDSDWANEGQYAFLWTGDKYLAIRCREELVGRNSRYAPHWNQLHEKSFYFLDEGFQVIEQGDIEQFLGEDYNWATGIGFQNGVYYLRLWDYGDVILRSTDGETWQLTDLPQLMDSLTEPQ
ncbi:MAG: hypothetical protein HFF05_06060 [Oscillospiraceae bacterium]|nr:hypothetical protein [Oscillospiraceae bacterium]